jgi:hypothetical protein
MTIRFRAWQPFGPSLHPEPGSVVGADAAFGVLFVVGAHAPLYLHLFAGIPSPLPSSDPSIPGIGDLFNRPFAEQGLPAESIVEIQSGLVVLPHLSAQHSAGS